MIKKKWPIYLSSVILLYCAYYTLRSAVSFYNSLPPDILETDIAALVIVPIIFIVLALCAAVASYQQLYKRKLWTVMVPCVMYIILQVLDTSAFFYFRATSEVAINIEFNEIIGMLSIPLMLFPIFVNLRKRPIKQDVITATFN